MSFSIKVVQSLAPVPSEANPKGGKKGEGAREATRKDEITKQHFL